MAKIAADCTTMAEIRENIDRVDHALIALFAERWSFIRRAAEIKADFGIPADVPERVREVRDNAHRNAETHALDGDFYEEIWAQLIEHAIAYEKAQLGEA